MHVDFTRSGGHPYPFILCRSLSFSSTLRAGGVRFVGHDLVRPGCSGLSISSKVTFGHRAAVNFGQRDCWSAEARLSTDLFTSSCTNYQKVEIILDKSVNKKGSFSKLHILKAFDEKSSSLHRGPAPVFGNLSKEFSFKWAVE